MSEMHTPNGGIPVTLLSPHFHAAEFACPHCREVGRISTRLLGVLENARRAAGNRPLHIVSGYRCPVWNRRVGGIERSEHLLGRAADVPGGYLTASQWEAAGAVGIGIRRGRVVHVDVTPGRRPFRFDD